VEEVDQFTYLRSVISADVCCGTVIRHKIAFTNKRL